jgi:ribosomal protein S18 acetylase RimI-like enzyme
MDKVELLALVDTQLRQPDGERVGPIVRTSGEGASWISYSALSVEDADAVIAEQRDHFTRLGRQVEWKYYAHDQPADLPDRLAAAGFVAEPTEALMVAELDALLAGPLGDAVLPAGVRLEPVDVGDAEGFAGINALQTAVWGAGWRGLGNGLAAEQAADPAAIAIFRAVAVEETVSAGWVRFHAGTPFASIWGGSTLPAWRRRGIFRALVGHRARLAAERGFRYLQVDASDDSRPILARLGFVVLTTTTPYVWTPPA